MKTFKITLIMAVFASSLFLQSCETDPALDTIDGVEFASQTFQENAPCDNTSNPTCAFLLPMDYASAAPIIAERALRQCPYGRQCVYVSTSGRPALEDWCPSQVNTPSCNRIVNLPYGPALILTPDQLNSAVCALSGAIRASELQGKNIETLILNVGQHPVNGITNYFYIATISYLDINPNITPLCQ